MIKELLQEGFILKTKGYYKHAIEAFYKALELDNSSPELLLEIADVYYLMGDEERALNYIEQVLENYPTHVDSMKLLKRIFENKQAWAEAEQTAKNIYCITKDSNVLTEIFALLNKQNNYDEIFTFSVEELTPEMEYEMAYAKFMKKDFVEALELINKVLDSDFNNKNLLLKGKILYKLNRKDECVELIKELSIDETNAELLNFVGLIKQYEQDYKHALRYLLMASKLAPNNDEYYYNCASTYFKMDDITFAKKYYNLAISIAPDNQNYHFALANLYYSEKHYKRALEELNYDFFEAKLLKSIILYDSGYLALAKKELENLAEEHSDHPMVIDYKNRITEELRL